MRRQFLTSIGLTLLFASVAAAQQRSVPPLSMVAIGPFVGLNYTTLYGSDAESANSRTDFAAGGQMDVMLGRFGFFRTGLIYSRRGAETTEQGFKVALKLKYLELPLLFGYRLPREGGVRPYLMGGGQLGIKVGCTAEVTDRGVTSSADCDNPDVDANVKSTDFAALGGAGLSVPLGGNSLSFDLRYALGLVNVIKDAKVKNRGLTVGLALMVPIGK